MSEDAHPGIGGVVQLVPPCGHRTDGIDDDLSVFLAEMEYHEVIALDVEGVTSLQLPCCTNHLYRIGHAIQELRITRSSLGNSCVTKPRVEQTDLAEQQNQGRHRR